MVKVSCKRCKSHPVYLPQLITSPLPQMSRTLSRKALVGYLRRLVLNNYGWESTHIDSRIDLELKDIVLNQLVNLELYLNEESMNLIILFFARLQELDMLAITLTKFESLGIFPNTETFNTIFWCLWKLFSAEKLPETVKYRYIVPVIHKMRLNYHLAFNNGTFQMLLPLISAADKRLELIRLMSFEGLDLKLHISEVSEALYEEYGQPEQFDDFVTHVEKIVLQEGAQFNHRQRQKVLKSVMKVCLQSSKLNKAMTIACHNEELVSSRIISMLNEYFVTQKQYWHCIACTNWYIKMREKSENASLSIQRISQVLFPILIRSGKFAASGYFLPFLNNLCTREAKLYLDETTRAQIELSLTSNSENIGTIFEKDSGIRDEITANLIWVDPSNPDNSFRHENFILAAKLLGFKVEAFKDDSEYVAEQDKKNAENADYGAELYAGSMMRKPSDLEGATSLILAVSAVSEKRATIKPPDTGEFCKQDMLDVPPDGTFWGWTTCICVMLINTFSWGTNTVYGVFLDYYVSTNHFPEANMEEYALIGGLCLGFSFMLISVANTLIRRFHYKLVMSFGAMLIVICFCAASVAKTITQLIMLQGFLMSIGFALTAGPTFVMIPSWFLKKRSVAQGIGAAGVGLAGVIFSKPVQVMIETDGDYQWALRMMGIICGVMLAISIALIRTRRPLQVKNDSLLKTIWHNCTRWDIYLRAPMACVIMWNFIYGLAFAVLLFSFSSYSTSIGLTQSQGSMVTLVESIAQTVGRPILGLLSDRYGRANTTILVTTFLGIICLCWWTFVKSYANLLIFGFVAGFFMGINWVNFSPLSADVVGGGDDLLAAISMLTFLGGMPQVVAEIIGLKLKRPGMTQPFLYCQILVGVACLVSAAILLPFREWKIKKILSAREKCILAKDPILRTEKDELRLDRYKLILQSTFKGRVIRAFYPVRA
ncbi:hypothetical protein FOA43_002428 [Brettanomyces nanus]|uniref:Major facilitator superfamily (MFS) profile domain-containing protein n=1 Tax=Eeniella nana TaxID=13502 RepID=A0A875RUZ3_EENNA|nr:uncharacterized protein FOA43_002428 [Brettanomyces nanus]QPG75087.1 hypothetical protein FOA43_002428 [Brettanomyces nanus]